MESILIKEKEYLNLFKISILIKGISALGEMLSGTVVWFTSKVFLITFILNFFQNDLTDNPKDYIANFIVNSAAALSVSSQYVLGAYLFLHGFIKIFLIINLFRKKLWAYPTSIIVFSLFIIYEVYGYYYSNSIWILAIILFDILIVVLAIHEYKILRKKLRNI